MAVKNKKKVILFLVEGISEEEALATLISNAVERDKIVFKLINGDITSNRGSNSKNIKRKVNEKVKQFIEDTKVKKSDILSIVHLMDIDGAYIVDDKSIVEDKHIYKGFIYYPKEIHCKNKNDVIERNKRKSSTINILSSTDEISDIGYRCYYFCCNLDHVIHNEANLDSHKKVDYAEDFQDKYYDREDEFIKFMCDSEFAVKGDYKSTWEYLKKDMNSLGRHSNFNLFFEDFTLYLKKEYR